MNKRTNTKSCKRIIDAVYLGFRAESDYAVSCSSHNIRTFAMIHRKVNVFF